MALNRRPRHGSARQVLGEERSRQPMIGAAVHDPKRQFATVNCRNAKSSFTLVLAILEGFKAIYKVAIIQVFSGSVRE
jgi:hypothetical protein